MGQYPARFEIIKMRLLFLKYILQQSEESMIDKFFQLQPKNPAKQRSALNLHLCIDYYIQNHLNTHHNTSRNNHLYTRLYWVGVRWAVTKYCVEICLESPSMY